MKKRALFSLLAVLLITSVFALPIANSKYTDRDKDISDSSDVFPVHAPDLLRASKGKSADQSGTSGSRACHYRTDAGHMALLAVYRQGDKLQPPLRSVFEHRRYDAVVLSNKLGALHRHDVQ